MLGIYIGGKVFTFTGLCTQWTRVGSKSILIITYLNPRVNSLWMVYGCVGRGRGRGGGGEGAK